MTWTPSPRPARSEWLTKEILREAMAFMACPLLDLPAGLSPAVPPGAAQAPGQQRHSYRARTQGPARRRRAANFAAANSQAPLAAATLRQRQAFALIGGKLDPSSPPWASVGEGTAQRASMPEARDWPRACATGPMPPSRQPMTPISHWVWRKNTWPCRPQLRCARPLKPLPARARTGSGGTGTERLAADPEARLGT